MGRVDELTDGYIRHLEDENDRLTDEINSGVDAYNLLLDFIQRQYDDEDFDFYPEHEVLMEKLAEIDPSLVEIPRPAGPPALRVVTSAPEPSQ
jgi:hypothetical protein